MNFLLSSAYFPNIRYFSKLIQNENIYIEINENFPKQTYRNRCNILSTNGILPIIVPVLNGRSGKIKTKDIKISYIEKWQHEHFHSIESAYRSSPYYDYYIDEIHNLFKKKYSFLLDLNNEILKYFAQILNIKSNFIYTDNFISTETKDYKDYRFSISPKNKLKDDEFNPTKYIQVFSDKFIFTENLSILDLIFNLGPESKTYLINCNKNQ